MVRYVQRRVQQQEPGQTSPVQAPLDLIRWVQTGETLQGLDPIGLFPRVVAEQVAGGRAQAAGADTRALRWSLVGHPQVVMQEQTFPMVELSVQCKLAVPCQRCHGALVLDVASTRQIALADSEALADQLAAELDDELDAIVQSRSFDLRELIEDEVLLALPFAPKHEDCALPQTRLTQANEVSSAAAEAADDEGAHRPARVVHPGMAALAALKGRLKTPVTNASNVKDVDSSDESA